MKKRFLILAAVAVSGVAAVVASNVRKANAANENPACIGAMGFIEISGTRYCCAYAQYSYCDGPGDGGKGYVRCEDARRYKRYLDY